MPRIVSLLLLFLASSPAQAADADVAALAKQLRELDSRVLPMGVDHGRMLSDDIRKRIQEANERETAAWKEIKTREQWERYRDKKIKALRDSLNLPDEPRGRPKTHVTGTIKGDGYIIENLVFESRPGLWVTANLYQPARPRPSMEAIFLCHSHHAPKWQGELQDMGITWARLGCAVLVMDQLGHGERRQHPFVDEKSFAGKFRPSRQDYYFRYNVALQLELVGESLMGWMVWDLMRGVDLLCSMPNVDNKAIFLLGSVAGGGDPAAVAAALDHRIKCVVPFNFGGPQPETTFPLPADPEKAFNYAGSGSWESTRNLRNSIRDGFFPWVIVGAAAPRYLIYAHEFAWDREHDPVWKRLETIYSFYDADDNLDSAHGRGKVTGQPPESTHCTNIGPEHRKQIYESFREWFEIPIPKNDRPARRTVQELTCLTPEIMATLTPDTKDRKATGPQKVHELAADLVNRRYPLSLRGHTGIGRLPKFDPFTVKKTAPEALGDARCIRLTLKVERELLVPILLLLPKLQGNAKKYPVVVCVAQDGKAGFLKQRADGIAELLSKEVAVCLPDLRGCGETKPAGGRGRQSTATALSSSEQMLGGSLLRSRMDDFFSILRALQDCSEIDSERTAVWGDSFAPVNQDSAKLTVPWDAENLPRQSEPLGGLVALLSVPFGGLKAVCVRGGLLSYRSLVESPFLYVPHDTIPPGVLEYGDLSQQVVRLAPTPIWLEGLVDGVNRRVDTAQVHNAYGKAVEAYKGAAEAEKLRIEDHHEDCRLAASWLIEQLKAK
jgi:cephalosporin-C deacetylase-like acetyl esterase